MLYLYIHIYGKVHKTGLRYFLKQKASQLNISGCVFYRDDHSVNVIAQGESSEIDKFVKHCKDGNVDSIIEKIIVKQCPGQVFNSFEVVDDRSTMLDLNNANENNR